MSTATAAGIGLVLLPVHFNVAFALLGARFDYPDILRRPAGEILERFAAGGPALVRLWLLFALSAVVFIPVAALLGPALAGAPAGAVTTAVALGAAAGIVQAVGLVRWPFAVPALARAHEDPERRAAAEVTFDALHRALGEGVGEHLGYLLTGAWTVAIGIAMLGSTAVPDVLGIAALALSPAFLVGAFRLESAAIPVAYVAWSAWLLATGVVLLA